MPSMRTVNKAVCLVLMPGTAALVVWWWGWSLWTLLLVAVMLSCPLILLYLWYESYRSQAALRSAATFLRDKESTGRRDVSGRSGRAP